MRRVEGLEGSHASRGTIFIINFRSPSLNCLVITGAGGRGRIEWNVNEDYEKDPMGTHSGNALRALDLESGTGSLLTQFTSLFYSRLRKFPLSSFSFLPKKSTLNLYQKHLEFLLY